MGKTQWLTIGLMLCCLVGGCRQNRFFVYDQEAYPDGTLHWLGGARTAEQAGWQAVYYPSGRPKEVQFEINSNTICRLTFHENGMIQSEEFLSPTTAARRVSYDENGNLEK